MQLYSTFQRIPSMLPIIAANWLHKMQVMNLPDSLFACHGPAIWQSFNYWYAAVNNASLTTYGWYFSLTNIPFTLAVTYILTAWIAEPRVDPSTRSWNCHSNGAHDCWSMDYLQSQAAWLVLVLVSGEFPLVLYSRLLHCVLGHTCTFECSCTSVCFYAPIVSLVENDLSSKV